MKLKAMCKFGENDIQDSFKIRKTVFIEEQGVPKEIELDDKDSICHHVIIYHEDKAIATGRIIPKDGEIYLGRVAVLKEYRKKGVGRALVEAMIDKTKELGEKKVLIHSQLSAAEFYKSLGFKEFGEVFQEAGIDHVNMVYFNESKVTNN